MNCRNVLRRMGIALAGLVWLIVAPRALSQSCSLCYTQAASSGSRMIEALRSGILVLIVPPTLMWLVLAAVLYVKRNRYKSAGTKLRSDLEWQ